MYEYIVNLHIHTPFSDGTGFHQEIAQAAIEAGIDVIIVTDHNVWVDGLEGYYPVDQDDQGDLDRGEDARGANNPQAHGDRGDRGGDDGAEKKQVLMLVGEEIHDQIREPQKNHMLVFGAARELAPLAYDPQLLIDAVNEAEGLAFLAHIVDPESETFGEADLSWVDWDIHGFTGIELWNSMSEFKSHLTGRLRAIYYAFNPEAVAHGPFPASLEKWDELLSQGLRVVAVGGSDAHAMVGRMGPIKRILFPYGFHFQAINTHIQTQESLNGELEHDRQLVLDALRHGRAFIGYDLPASTRGFNFRGQGLNSHVAMGGEVSSVSGVTLQIRLPMRTECHLLHDGQVIKTWDDRDSCTHITTEPGVYRVEVFTTFRGKRRGWIYSNPIYVK